MSYIMGLDRAMLNKVHKPHMPYSNGAEGAWLSGPEGGASQMFLCHDCKTEFVVHPGCVEEIGQLDKQFSWRYY